MRSPRSSLLSLGPLLAPSPLATPMFNRGSGMLVIDANVIRSVIVDNQDISAFVTFVHEGGTIHLADGALVEALSWLHRTKDAWARWMQGRSQFDDFIDPERPVLMGGREILRQAGFRLDNTPPSLLVATDQERFNREAWRELLVAPALGAIGRHQLAVKTPKGRRRVLWKPSGAQKQVAREKASWIEMFGRYDDAAQLEGFAITGRTVPRELLEAQVANLGQFIDKKTTSTPAASVRLDAMIRVHVLLSLRRRQTREPYNAKKEANDVFDLDLYRYLALPAALCTSDQGIINDVRAAGSWQADWVVTPALLADPAVRKRLLDLRWPTQEDPSDE